MMLSTCPIDGDVEIHLTAVIVWPNQGRGWHKISWPCPICGERMTQQVSLRTGRTLNAAQISAMNAMMET